MGQSATYYIAMHQCRYWAWIISFVYYIKDINTNKISVQFSFKSGPLDFKLSAIDLLFYPVDFFIHTNINRESYFR